MSFTKQPTTATIVITTKDRKDDLRRALSSCVRQSFPCEILVIDDGSQDGTAQMVREEFPQVKLVRQNESGGLIARRNDAARLANGEVIVSIDDDAELSDADIVRQTLADFHSSRIGAVAIPFINIRQNDKIYQKAPSTSEVWITNEFIGTAHALRKDLFHALGGYRESFVRQHEEGDFCIRMLDAGFYVALGQSQPVLHFESPARSREREEVFGQRNLIMFAWLNVPMPELLWHLPATIINGLIWGCRTHCLWFRLRGTISGIKGIVASIRERRPVTRSTYALYRRLKKAGPVRFEDDRPPLAARPSSIQE